MTPALPLRQGVAAGARTRGGAVRPERPHDLDAVPTAGAADVSTFTQAVAHDLREPLRAIAGYATALAEDFGARLPAEGRDLIDRLRAAAATLDQRVDGLLRLSRTEQASLRRAPCDLAPLAARVLADLRRLDPSRIVTTGVPDAIAVHGDATLLGIVLENLLTNAWKYTRGRRDARIDVLVSSSTDAAVISVRDNGIGFEMTQAHRLGLPFQRLHTAGHHEGIGLGLASVRRIVERHGGRLWAEGSPGAGATFHVSLPSAGTR